MGRYLLCALALAAIGCSSKDPAADKPEPGSLINQTNPTNAAPEKPGPAQEQIEGVIDMPLYPGASVKTNTVAENDGQKRYHLMLETTDTAKKVGEFYTSKGMPTEIRGTEGQFMGVTKKGNNILMFIEEKNGKTGIKISVSPATH